MDTEKYARKPLIVDAVLVTEENMSEVAEWCGGEIKTNPDSSSVPPESYILVEVERPLYDRQKQAFAGDWVLYLDRTGYKVYTPKGFENAFIKVEEPIVFKDGIDWDIDANLPMYTRDYLKMRSEEDFDIDHNEVAIAVDPGRPVLNLDGPTGFYKSPNPEGSNAPEPINTNEYAVYDFDGDPGDPNIRIVEASLVAEHPNPEYGVHPVSVVETEPLDEIAEDFLEMDHPEETPEACVDAEYHTKTDTGYYDLSGHPITVERFMDVYDGQG